MTRVVLLFLLLISFLWNSVSASNSWALGCSLAEFHSLVCPADKAHCNASIGRPSGNVSADDGDSMSSIHSLDSGVHYAALLNSAVGLAPRLSSPDHWPSIAQLLLPEPLLDGLMRPPRAI